MSQSGQNHPLIFADSNVFVEALFVEESDAALVLRLVVSERYTLATCAAVASDVERAISHKTKLKPADTALMLNRWEVMRKKTNLVVHQDADVEEIRAAYSTYIAVMRHKNDIPILAAALRYKPKYILSNNREHFNDAVAKKCGVIMVSCEEFIELVAGRRKS